MTEKRVSSEQEIAYRYKRDGAFVRHSCDPIIPGRCKHYEPYRCILTGEEIIWPASGPVGDRCPLEGYEFPEGQGNGVSPQRHRDTEDGM